jgi:hypothetical protein
MPIHVKSTFISKPSHASHQTRSRSIQDDRCYKLIFSIDWRCIIRRQCKRAKVSILHTDELVTGIQLPNLAGWSGNSDAQKFALPCSASSTYLTPPGYSSRALDDAGGPAHNSSFGPLSPSWFQDLDLPSMLGSPYETGSYVSNSLLITPDPSCTGALQPQFSQRTRSIQQGSLTTKMLFSKLADYTKMMGEGKTLPPFIHPPCCLGQGDECTPNSPHQCLPEILAVCANLTQIFHARISGSCGYVWQQICTHLRQLRAEVRPELM